MGERGGERGGGGRGDGDAGEAPLDRRRLFLLL